MPRRCSPISKAAIIATTIGSIATSPSFAGSSVGGVGGATEFTQLLNNGQLIQLAGQSAQQINNQIQQIAQLAQQIQNQLRIYQNMLQNTAQLPSHVWGQAENDIKQLQNIVNQGQGMAFSMGNIDDVLKQRFQSYAQFKTNLPNGASFASTYQTWSTTNRDTISSTLQAAGLTSQQFATENSTMAQLQTASESADGQMKALQVGHEIAAQEVAQMQKLRGLVAQQTTMMATWFQSSEAGKDLSQARREQFFNASAPATSGGQTMEPRW
ncbi:P-type conjugative transfer protein TrbJ (plasmid) [Bradyrhizobium sp. ISRA443]|uniref:P-type conjugative transfer protein TrbJ n=1 Tax=unclassified Bradyrhizobium TaxID=2631580 RepID=UPI00247A76DD|nr:MULTISPECIES: P-type conjugative transfer protein TrbJ [unclassified Bradyrhizobium]WGR90653.1 P-type conjugative transfer protein TrbJ [Bradyrhizobium sp. ISRA435]WGS02993.1 P-type conjugative transfer protein TrbJ [Bradyrhizobium sp. ISRA436]WGS09970.1 P-type conjugative transfer protein TrbJ [Bradyrhizobium sp. ISRA437]WGS16855.1 P-type conjugative transfer protein TrbJ [Bradyrhizobium sp. ISRA443]